MSERRDEVAGARLRRQRAALDVRAGKDARADHEVGVAVGDGRDQARQLARIVGAVGVEEDEDVGARRVRAAGGDAAQAGGAVAAMRLGDHLGAAGARQLDGAIARAVVDDDDGAHAGGAQIGEHAGQRLLLVERGDDGVDDHRARIT